MLFLRRLDRYVTRRFLATLALSLAALTVIFVLIHIMDHVDVYIDHDTPWSTVGRYYLLQMPYNTLLTLPMAVLIATIISIGEMGRHGELTDRLNKTFRPQGYFLHVEVLVQDPSRTAGGEERAEMLRNIVGGRPEPHAAWAVEWRHCPGLLGLCVVLWALTPHFLTVSNLLNVAQLLQGDDTAAFAKALAVELAARVDLDADQPAIRLHQINTRPARTHRPARSQGHFLDFRGDRAGNRLSAARGVGDPVWGIAIDGADRLVADDEGANVAPRLAHELLDVEGAMMERAKRQPCLQNHRIWEPLDKIRACLSTASSRPRPTHFQQS